MSRCASRGSIDSMQDFKGGWVTSLTGFREGDPISWMHRLTVRKVKGQAGVAWEEWLDCAVQATDCKAAKAGKQTGVQLECAVAGADGDGFQGRRTWGWYLQVDSAHLG